MPLGEGASISKEDVVRSTRVERTFLEVESNSPEGSVDGADTLSPTSTVLLEWVGGVLWPLPLVAPRLTMWRGMELEMEQRARVMRKSTRPAGGTFEPCS